MSNQITFNDDELALLLIALGEYKAKQYLIDNYSLSHRASELLSKIKNGN